MNLVIGGIIVVVATAVGVAAMLAVRRRALEGSYFSDGDRASGIFGVPESFAITQALLVSTVVIVVTSLLLLVAFLDDPFQGGVGGLRPTAMERTLRLMDEELHVVRRTTGAAVPIPCDTRGGAR